MKKLKSLAESLGCTVEDDRENTTLYIHAPEGKAWEGGTLSTLCHGYGSHGSYLANWRQEAIQEAFQRLTELGEPVDDYRE
jgi:hypothetical protein